MARECFPRVSLHEREVQRPPGESQKGNPDELTLQKEPHKRNLAIENRLENGNVYPALVIADDKIILTSTESLEAFDPPVRARERAEEPAVDAQPALGDSHEDSADRAASA